VAHRFWLLMTHDRKQEMILQPHPLSHKEYMTFGDDKKGKLLGSLNDAALMDRLRYNLLSVPQLVDDDLHVLL
jgi:hypothetical protein